MNVGRQEFWWGGRSSTGGRGKMDVTERGEDYTGERQEARI